jgi:hypothetical protein
MRNIALLVGRAPILLAAAAALSGCVSASHVPDRSPSWTKQMVAGSRIPRRVDSFGEPDTGTMVQVITDESLEHMPGASLGEKLSGGSR